MLTPSLNVKHLDANLEDVERFKLDVLAVVSKQVHHQCQVLCPTDVLCHVGPGEVLHGARRNN